jgi:rubrerythrin
MDDAPASDAVDALRAGLRQIAAAVTRAQYLAGQADVDGEPALAVALRAMAERNQGLAQGLYALLAEEAGTADTRPGTDDLVARLPVEAEMYASLAEEIRGYGRPDLASWMDKLASAQRDHEARLQLARNASDAS